MDSSRNKRWVAVCLIAAASLCLHRHGAAAEPEVPCFFIYGDSLADPGNNNHLITLAKANYTPYGIDFPYGPTGRFSNGETTVDVVAKLLGFIDYIPPYTAAPGPEILRGVNYASGSAGILSETNQGLGERIDFTRQVNNYMDTVEKLVSIIGDEASAANYLGKCIYSVGIGSNDLIDYPIRSHQYSPEQYTTVLIRMYTQQLKRLYDTGARKFSLIGIGQIGCTPSVLARNSSDGKTCVKRFNDFAELFNSKLVGVVDVLNQWTSDANFIYINAYGISGDLLANPAAYGLTVTNVACCGSGRNNGEITCLPRQTPCENRDNYFFWDPFHPTQATFTIVARRSYTAEKVSDAYPFDIHRLAQL